jgi:hypothetical protein
MIYRQGNSKVKKFSCVLWRLEVLGELEILVSGGFNLEKIEQKLKVAA